MASFLDWGNKALDYYNNNPALQLGVQGGLSYLGSSGQRDANNTSTGQIIAGQQKGLDTLNKTWGTAQRQASPYLQFGKTGLAQYTNLIKNPNSIRNDPGYLFRLNEGSDNLERSAAAAGTHLSGGTLADLTKYGQEYATAEYDKALNRRIPMIETGLNTQQNLAQLGAGYADAIGQIYGNIGGAQAAGTQANQATRRGTLGDVSDILTRLSDGQSLVSGAQKGLSMLGGNTGAAGTLAGGMGAMEALGGAGTAAGVVGAPVAAPYAGGYAMQGSVAAMDALGGGGATTLGGGGLSGLGAAPTAAPTGATSLASGAATGTGLGGLAMAGGVLAMPFVMKALRAMTEGGSSEESKTPKLYAQLQRDQQADPSGRAAQATIAKLINGKLWAGEGNGWVVADLFKSGALSMESPVLYSKQSTMDITPSAKSSAQGGMYLFGKLAGMNDQQIQEMSKAASPVRKNNSSEESQGPGYHGTAEQISKRKADSLKAMTKKYMPKALASATALRTKLLAANPKADVTKLNQFIKENK